MLYFLTCIYFLIALCPVTAHSKLAVELSSNKVDIDSDFHGIDLLIFGSKKPEDDLIIIVRGCKKNFTIATRKKIYGIWVVEKEKKIIENGEVFYYLAATKPLKEFDQTTLRKLGLGIKNIKVGIKNAHNNAEFQYFKKIFYQLCIQKKLYAENKNDIKMLDEILFKENISFPHNINLGNYIAEAFLFKNNELKAAKILPIQIEDRGFGALVSRIAKKHKTLYGICTILAGMFIGWLSGAVFKRI